MFTSHSIFGQVVCLLSVFLFKHVLCCLSRLMVTSSVKVLVSLYFYLVICSVRCVFSSLCVQFVVCSVRYVFSSLCVQFVVCSVRCVFRQIINPDVLILLLFIVYSFVRLFVLLMVRSVNPFKSFLPIDILLYILLNRY